MSVDSPPRPPPFRAEDLSLDALVPQLILMSSGGHSLVRYHNAVAERHFLVKSRLMPPGFMTVPKLPGRDALHCVVPTMYIPAEIGVLKGSRAVLEVIDTEPLCSVLQLMESVPGGVLDLDTTRYIAACVVLGLEDCHRSRVAYRGLCADTLVLSADGYAQLVEFRHARQLLGRTYTICGAPDYMAPEMLEMRGHLEVVDWWSLGVLIYTMLTGMTPFSLDTEDELQLSYNIVQGQVDLFPEGSEVSQTVPEEAQAVVEGLLEMDPLRRLGRGNAGLVALKMHPFFSTIDWGLMETGQHLVPDSLRRAMERFEETEEAAPSPDSPQQLQDFNHHPQGGPPGSELDGHLHPGGVGGAGGEWGRFVI